MIGERQPTSRQIGNGGLPGPAPKTIIDLAGWQSGRGGLSTGATVGRGDRGEATTAISIPRAELFTPLIPAAKS
jgi:hypothetical protein